eukprot:417030_1
MVLWNKRSVSMQIWVTTMQKAIRFDGNKQKYGSRRWFYGSLRCKKRSVSMEISTDSDPKDGFMDHYDAKSEPFRWKQAEIWIQKMVLWITTMQKDRYDAKSDYFRWK